MRVIKWKAKDGEGLERLMIAETDASIRAEGWVIGTREGEDYGVRYVVECSTDWVTRRLHLEVQSGVSLTLTSNGLGTWTNNAGLHQPELDGCIDVDISATPFTNTLPIRRLKLAQAERRRIRVAYIPVPSLRPSPAEQAYTCVEPGRRYRYEGIFRNFEADLRVDDAGLVIDYPSLFSRV
jgi:hypothetical protein